MNSLAVKISAIVGVVALIVALLFVVKYQNDRLKKQSDDSVIEMKRLRDDIVRAQSQYVNKQDLENFAKNQNINLKPIEDDLAKLHAEIKGISSVLFVTPGYSGTDLPSTNTGPGPNPGGNSGATIPCPSGGSVECPSADPFGYQSHRQILALQEPLGNDKFIPFGETGFNAWKPAPWDLKVYPRQYNLTTVLGEDADGRHYQYNKFSITSNGVTVPVTITDAKFVELKPTAAFRFSPRIYMGFGAGMYLSPPQAEVVPNLDVALFSYGQTKTSPDWTFGSLGLGYASQANSVSVLVTPFAYNAAKHLPLVDNLFLGPQLMLNTSGSFAVLGGLQVGL